MIFHERTQRGLVDLVHREATRLAAEVALASMPLRSGSEAALASGSDALPPCQSANAMIA